MSLFGNLISHRGFSATAALAAASLALLSTSLGHGAQRHAVNPNSPKPDMCDKNSGPIPNGTWLQNKPCGYYIGRAMAGSSFDNHANSDAGFHYGRTHGNNNFCAWVPPGALADEATEVADSCGSEIREALAHRLTFGKDFNAAPGANDGSPAGVDPGCPAYYNYFTSSDFTAGSLHDEAVGTLGTDVVIYRYTTLDGGAMVVRHPNPDIGWVFVPRSCFKEPQGWVFNNDAD